MAFRSLMIPCLSGGAVLLGVAALAWQRGKRLSGAAARRQTRESAGAARERSLGAAAERAAAERLVLAAAPSEPRALGTDDSSVPRNDRDAQFLARVTDVLSPFGSRATRARLEVERLGFESGMSREASGTRVASGAEDLDSLEEWQPAPESERRTVDYHGKFLAEPTVGCPSGASSFTARPVKAG